MALHQSLQEDEKARRQEILDAWDRTPERRGVGRREFCERFGITGKELSKYLKWRYMRKLRNSECPVKHRSWAEKDLRMVEIPIGGGISRERTVKVFHGTTRIEIPEDISKEGLLRLFGALEACHAL